jgi:hypothetical protein
LRPYFNTILIYVKVYFINFKFFASRNAAVFCINELKVLSYFKTNWITLTPDFYSQNKLISKIQFQNILTSLEEGTEKLIQAILDKISNMSHTQENIIPFPPIVNTSEVASGLGINSETTSVISSDIRKEPSMPSGSSESSSSTNILQV